MRLGMLLPHFGSAADADEILSFAEEVEALGFDSVWARDNLNFRPLEFEPPGHRFIDPFTILTAVAARTKRLGVGTAVLTPFRPPLVAAQLVGGLSLIAEGRFELGVGPGTPRRPWEAVGVDYDERIDRCRETVEVIRAVSGPGEQSYSGRFAQFEGVDLDPAPSPELTVWYGGASRHALDALSTYADGLMPGRCPLPVLQSYVRRHVESGRGSGAPRLAMQTLVVPAPSRSAALERLHDAGAVEAISRRWKQELTTIDDLLGAAVAGPPDDCLEQLQTLVAADVELIVLDFRLAGGSHRSQVRAFANDVASRFGTGPH